MYLHLLKDRLMMGIYRIDRPVSSGTPLKKIAYKANLIQHTKELYHILFILYFLVPLIS